MRKCAKCGYVRSAVDDEFTNAPVNACPKCYTFYEQDQSPAWYQRDEPTDFISRVQTRASRLYKTEIRQTRSSTYWLFTILVFAALTYFLAEKPGPEGIAVNSRSPSVAADKTYCHLDENGMVQFIKNPEKTASNYILLTRSDGSLDRLLYEKWVFEMLGGNPFKIDPQAEGEAERARLPDHFRKIFPGYELANLERFTPEARAYWDTWVSNRLQEVSGRAARAKEEGMARHRQWMEAFDRYARS